jgi:hypothetical protein
MTKETKKKVWMGVIGFSLFIGIIGENIDAEPTKHGIEKAKESVKEVKKAPVEKEVIKGDKNTLVGGYGVCVSAELFDELISLSVQKDYKGMDYLLKNGCFVLPKGVKFSLIDRSFTGTAKIRVYLKDKSMIVWTNNENLNL